MFRNICCLTAVLAPLFFLSAIEYTLETKVSYLYPVSGVFREIYGEGQAYGLEFMMRQDRFEAFVCLEEWRARGRAIVEVGQGSKTSIQILPFSFGAKYWWVLQRFGCYTSLGLVLDNVRIKNQSNLVERHVLCNSLGFLMNFGTSFHLDTDWVLDLFGGYTFQNLSVRGSDPTIRFFNVDLSRFQLGAGIGIVF